MGPPEPAFGVHAVPGVAVVLCFVVVAAVGALVLKCACFAPVSNDVQHLLLENAPLQSEAQTDAALSAQLQSLRSDIQRQYERKSFDAYSIGDVQFVETVLYHLGTAQRWTAGCPELGVKSRNTLKQLHQLTENACAISSDFGSLAKSVERAVYEREQFLLKSSGTEQNLEMGRPTTPRTPSSLFPTPRGHVGMSPRNQVAVWTPRSCVVRELSGVASSGSDRLLQLQATINSYLEDKLAFPSHATTRHLMLLQQFLQSAAKWTPGCAALGAASQECIHQLKELSSQSLSHPEKIQDLTMDVEEAVAARERELLLPVPSSTNPIPTEGVDGAVKRLQGDGETVYVLSEAKEWTKLRLAVDVEDEEVGVYNDEDEPVALFHITNIRKIHQVLPKGEVDPLPSRDLSFAFELDKGGGTCFFCVLFSDVRSRHAVIQALSKMCHAPIVEPDVLGDTFKMIESDGVPAYVINQRQEWNKHRLALNLVDRQLGLFDEQGEATALFDMSNIKRLVEILPDGKVDPPPSIDVSFAFELDVNGSILHLCVMFDEVEQRQLAIRALSELCDAPIVLTAAD